MAGKINREVALQRFKEKHGDRYLYDSFQWHEQHTKSVITCRIHGDFLMTPVSHWSGVNCPKCREEEKFEKFKNKIIAKHGEGYDLSRITLEKRIEIGCPKHGFFTINRENATHVSYDGGLCRKCGAEKRVKRRGATIIDEFNKVHNNFYDYSNFVYKGMLKECFIICPIHGEFRTFPVNHIRGVRCIRCVSGSPSKQENDFIEEISQLCGMPYESGVTIKSDRKPGYFKIDAVFGGVAVEFDGCYWHNLEDSVEKDIRKTNAIISEGYSVIRLRAFSKKWDKLPEIPNALNFHVNEDLSASENSEVLEKVAQVIQDRNCILSSL